MSKISKKKKKNLIAAYLYVYTSTFLISVKMLIFIKIYFSGDISNVVL